MFKNKNYSDYKIRLTVRSCIFYEQLTGKSFFAFGQEGTTEDDVLYMMYSLLIANNDLVLTFNSFKVLYGDQSFSKWLNEVFKDAMEMNSQFNRNDDDDEAEEADGEESVDMKKATITNVAAYLIGANHMSAEYVNDKMSLFEIKNYMKAIEKAEQNRLIEKRLWTYLAIAPHIDTKKIKSPQKLLPFDFEKKNYDKEKLEDLRRHKDEINKVVGSNMIEFFRPPMPRNDSVVYLNPEDNPDFKCEVETDNSTKVVEVEQ